MNNKAIEIVIGGTRHNVTVKEYQGKRVVTFKDIDELHERPEGTAKRNFNENKKQFITGEDYFEINQPYEIRTLGFERPQGGIPEKVILLTESGYLMLVKSLTDDLAWQVQRQLVKSYFRAKWLSFQSIQEYILNLPYDPDFKAMKGGAQVQYMKLVEKILKEEKRKEKPVTEKPMSTNRPAITSATTPAEKLQILLDAAISIDEFNPRSETELKSSVLCDKRFYYVLRFAIERYLGVNTNKESIYDAMRFMDGIPWNKRLKFLGKSKTYYTWRIPRKVIDIDIDRTPTKVYQLPK